LPAANGTWAAARDIRSCWCWPHCSRSIQEP